MNSNCSFIRNMAAPVHSAREQVFWCCSKPTCFLCLSDLCTCFLYFNSQTRMFTSVKCATVKCATVRCNGVLSPGTKTSLVPGVHKRSFGSSSSKRTYRKSCGNRESAKTRNARHTPRQRSQNCHRRCARSALHNRR